MVARLHSHKPDMTDYLFCQTNVRFSEVFKSVLKPCETFDKGRLVAASLPTRRHVIQDKSTSNTPHCISHARLQSLTWRSVRTPCSKQMVSHMMPNHGHGGVHLWCYSTGHGGNHHRCECESAALINPTAHADEMMILSAISHGIDEVTSNCTGLGSI